MYNLREQEAAPGTLLVEVAAFGVNHLDLELDDPGVELAGRVVAAGAGVTRFRPGDRVMALVAGGAYRPLAAVPAETAMRVPETVDLAAAAAMPEGLFTGWLNLYQLARLQPGEAVLIHGAAGGMGLVALRMAAALGHPVFATAGSEAKVAALRELHSGCTYNYRDPDWPDQLRSDRPQGVDVVYDVLGVPHLAASCAALAHGGRLALIDALAGERGAVDLAPFFAKQLTLTASLLRPQPPAVKARIAAGLEERVVPMLASGAFRPIPLQRFGDVTAAQAALRQRDRVGKVVVVR